MASRHPRPARTLIVLAVVIAGLYGMMAAFQIWTPKLGLDLRGGTTITLTASNTTGQGSVDDNSLEQARNIIEQRVNGLGVGEGEVTTAGGNQIIVSVPNVQQDELVRLVGRTAVLSFRKVYDVQPAQAEQPSGLPTAPPAPPQLGEPVPVEQRMDWQPTPEIQSEFAGFTCGSDFPEEEAQPLVACDQSGTQKLLLGPALINGDQLSDASAGVPQNRFEWVVNLEFDNEGATRFEEVTGQLATQADPQNRFAIVIDGVSISAPSVDRAIPGGQAEISGGFTQQTATELANVLRYGALPLAFEVSSVDNVSATLGGEQLEAGIIAGIIGMVLVLAFCVAAYRGLGIVVISSLLVAAALTWAALALLGEAVGMALNLPGIAGAIVAIGMTADSFVIYFERIRDELRNGRSLRSAVEVGWHDTKRTILIADAVQLLSAVVLFALAVGSVRGFAFTLGLTTLIDIVVVFWFTKPLMTLLARTRYFSSGARWSGLEPEHTGARPVRRRPLTPAKALAQSIASSPRSRQGIAGPRTARQAGEA
ncbi:protein translocase subunit SecD [Desertihabitans aurantiacus]|uniref:protein translocase subunit SecD n=1 Tax=Desertihabitans aurantiacus TaxID=2282477 RepID=UPI001E3384AC|nr:protein translocase subunit SecD [Desertihabitans aurantiacus]